MIEIAPARRGDEAIEHRSIVNATTNTCELGWRGASSFSFSFLSQPAQRHRPATRRDESGLRAFFFSRILSLPRNTRFVALVTTHEWLLRHAVAARGHARAVVRRLNHAEWTARRVAELRALPRYVSGRRGRTNGRMGKRVGGEERREEGPRGTAGWARREKRLQEKTCLANPTVFRL